MAAAAARARAPVSRRATRREASAARASCAAGSGSAPVPRRAAGAALLSGSALLLSGGGPAAATPRRKQLTANPEDYKPLNGTTIKYVDLKGGSGGEGGPTTGNRVAVHFDLKFRGITIGTSRQGAGVTGGSPYGFTVGAPAGSPGGPFIAAFNEGVKGMGVGTLRRMIVPAEFAYGNNQVQEIPPNATIQLDLELLSVVR